MHYDKAGIYLFKMFSLTVVFIVAVTAAVVTPRVHHGGGVCSSADALIYAHLGTTFPAEFRALGGWYVSRTAYERKIVARVGLSEGCARCYGAAYLCGWRNCKMACVSASERCDACLATAGCVEARDKCTGFIK